MEVIYGKASDIEPWMCLVDGVKWNFPGLETEEGLEDYRKTVLCFVEKKQALCVKMGDTIAGVMLFSRGHNMICCLAVSPEYRRMGIASMLLEKALSELDREKDITVSTFRENDEKGTAPRALYKKYGFAEDELIEEFGYPSKKFVLRRESMDNTNTWGQKVIEKALEYANYQWCATEKNVLHGMDENGVEVDTPDVTWKGEVLDCGWWKPNVMNTGIPYGWGRASTIEEFEKGLREGMFAGNVPEDKSRRGSYRTVGVDCSGLLTICWGLPKKIATRDIPNYATVVENPQDIQQGDILAKVGSHVMLFKEFADAEKKEVIIIDATRSTGKVSQRKQNMGELFAKGYKIYRRNPTETPGGSKARCSLS